VPARVDLPFLAHLCGLSQSRLAHVFTERLGISIRQYLLWVKMRAAAEMFVRHLSLAEVAHEIGFADSSHLSRTFMRYFALTPSFLANEKLVRMQVCESSLR
jgi:AraC family transcriptional regulator, arabinose operon regulatory protein